MTHRMLSHAWWILPLIACSLCGFTQWLWVIKPTAQQQALHSTAQSLMPMTPPTHKNTLSPQHLHDTLTQLENVARSHHYTLTIHAKKVTPHTGFTTTILHIHAVAGPQSIMQLLTTLLNTAHVLLDSAALQLHNKTLSLNATLDIAHD